MARFYNPYHFVPVEKPGTPQRELQVDREHFASKRPDHVTHERYVPGTHSGRLIVRLTTVTPIVIGAKQQSSQNGDSCGEVSPFLIDGRPAVPASTLRGLIGAAMEAASNAPLRVLDDRTYSYRRKMDGESLSAIGLIVREGDELRLKPMCLPTLESKDRGRRFEAPLRFFKIFPKPQFKVYFGTRRDITSPSFPYRTHKSKDEAVPMPVKQLEWSGNGVVVFDRSLHVKADRFAIAQKDSDLDDTKRPGLVRVLGCWGDRAAQIPGSKKHELWLPLPDPAAPALPILAEAMDRFEKLCDERTDRDERLPFEPKDTRPDPNDRGNHQYFRLRDGDMVYFDVDPQGKLVTELSLSAIWRGRVEYPKTAQAEGRPATAYSFFKEIDPELVPSNPNRKTISLVEQILGFADDLTSTGESASDSKALSLAGRLRFADAVLPDGVTGKFEPPAILRILDSPKPPCPPMYFKSRSGKAAYITKREMNPADHIPQGRKWYLHAKADAGRRPFETGKPRDSQKQKNRVEPLSGGQQFFFHIDFDNLSDLELGLLLFALEPDTKFHHKVGMGKPLGLGSVKVQLLGYCRIDREKRYQLDGLRAPRYSGANWTAAGKTLHDDHRWPARYSEEAAASPGQSDWIGQSRQMLLDSGIVSGAVQQALALLGDYAAAPAAADVHYPTLFDQHDKEAEHFKWFMFNDGHRERGRGTSPNRQFLKPLRFERSLPALIELEWD